MLMDLKRELKDGEQVQIPLAVEGKDGKRHSIQVTAPVNPLAAGTPSKHGH